MKKPFGNLITILSYFTLEELRQFRDKVDKLIELKEKQKEFFDLLMKNL